MATSNGNGNREFEKRRWQRCGQHRLPTNLAILLTSYRVCFSLSKLNMGYGDGTGNNNCKKKTQKKLAVAKEMAMAVAKEMTMIKAVEMAVAVVVVMAAAITMANTGAYFCTTWKLLFK